MSKGGGRSTLIARSLRKVRYAEYVTVQYDKRYSIGIHENIEKWDDDVVRSFDSLDSL